MIKRILIIMALVPFLIGAADNEWKPLKGKLLRNIVFNCCFYETDEFTKVILGQDLTGDGRPNICYVLKGMKDEENTLYYREIGCPPEELNV